MRDNFFHGFHGLGIIMSILNTYLELAISVDYDYDKGQKEILYPNDRAQEGLPPSITINEVSVGDVPITNHLSGEELESLENQIWDSMED